MKLLLISDTHGALAATQAVLEKEQADVVLHMGDVGFDPHHLGQVYYVKGNHDRESNAPKERLLTFCHKTIYMTHGDLYEREVFENLNRKYEDNWLDMNLCMLEFMDVLQDAGHRKHADVVCFGHTHQPVAEQRNGLWLVNPGSLAYPFDGKRVSYAVIELTEEELHVRLKYHPYDEK